MTTNSVVTALLLAMTLIDSSVFAQPCFNDTAAELPARPSSVCDAFGRTASSASYLKNETRESYCTAAGCTWTAANGDCNAPADESTVSCAGLTSLLACRLSRCAWTNAGKALQFSAPVEAVAASVASEVSEKITKSVWVDGASDVLLVHSKPVSALYTDSLMVMNRTAIRALAPCRVAAVLDAQRLVVCADALAPVLKLVRFSADFSTVAQWVVGYDAGGAEPIVSPFAGNHGSFFDMISYAKSGAIDHYWRVPLTVTADTAVAPTLDAVQNVPLPALPAANSTGVIEFVTVVGSTTFWAFRSDGGFSSTSQFMVNDTKVLDYPGTYTYNEIVHYYVAGGVAYIFHKGLIEPGFAELDGNDEVFVVNGQGQAFRAGRVPLNWVSMGVLPYIIGVSSDTSARKFLLRIQEGVRKSPDRNDTTVLEWNWCPGACSADDVESWDRSIRVAAAIATSAGRSAGDPPAVAVWGWSATAAESTVGANNATLVAGCKAAKPAGEKCPCPCHVCDVAESASARPSTRLACVVDVGACVKRPDGLFSSTKCDADVPLPTPAVASTGTGADASTTSGGSGGGDQSTTAGGGNPAPTSSGGAVALNAVCVVLALMRIVEF